MSVRSGIKIRKTLVKSYINNRAKMYDFKAQSNYNTEKCARKIISQLVIKK